MKPLNYESLLKSILRTFKIENDFDYYRFKRLSSKRTVECEFDEFNKKTGISKSAYSFKSLSWEVRLDTFLSTETLRIKRGSRRFRADIEFSIHKDGDYSKDRIELVQRIGDIMLEAFGE